MQSLQHILKNWAHATHMGFILWSMENKKLIGPFGFPAYCHTIFASPGSANIKCLKNGNGDYGELYCHAGLHEFILKVCLPDGQQIGKLVCGMVKTPKDIRPDFTEKSKEYEIPYLKMQLEHEYNLVNTKTNDEIIASRELLQSILDTFVEKSYRKWLLNQERSTDKTLSEITQQLYSYNITVNLTTLKYDLIIGAGMKEAVNAMTTFADYRELNHKLGIGMPEESLNKINSLIGIPALRSRIGTKGYVGQVEYYCLIDGKKQWHEARLFMGFDENGDPIANILGRDITEEHEKADAVAQLKVERAANVAKSRFLSNMSHDIRTPINGIMGMLAIARAHRSDQSRVDDCLNKIDTSSRHLLNLVNDILDLNKLESGKMIMTSEPCNFNVIISDVASIIRPLCREAGIKVYEPDMSEVKHRRFISSPLHLRQIFVNLLTNAIKYNKANGTVTTVMKEIACDDKTVTIQTTITDTGIGMSKKFQPHMFNAFEQENTSFKSSYKGSGLGLSIVKHIIDQMNGTIEVSSEESKGTTFTVTLTHRLDLTPAAANEPTDVELIDISGVKVLLVEDNELNMEIAQMILDDEGAVVTAATDGKAAIEAFKASAPGDFDIILMDVQMPKMDGLQAAKIIRLLPRPDAAAIPIFAMTANAFADDVAEAKAAGMNEHLAKPLDVPKMLATIAKYIKK